MNQSDKKRKYFNQANLVKASCFAAAMGATGFIVSSLEVSPLISALITGCAGISLYAFTHALSNRNVREDVSRIWEKHERLAREVARNRNEISALQKGLADIAASLTEQGKKHGPSASIEARLINTLVSRLASLGSKPATTLKTGSGRSHILEMQMIPPPANPPPTSALYKEMNKKQAKSGNGKLRRLVNQAISNDNIALFLQPVVQLPQRRAAMFEVFGRIPAEPGSWLPAEEYLDLARSYQLVPTIDRKILLKCLRLLKDKSNRDEKTAYILNIQPSTLKDGSFMNELVGFLSRNRDLAPRLIFEMKQQDFEAGDKALLELVRGITRLGCRFSLDQVRQRRLDINQLKGWNIRFVKLDARWLLQESHAKNGFAHVLRLKKELDSAGIDLIVEKIEQETILRELLDFNIDYGQGYLFGKPDIAAAYRTGPKKVA